jgi:GT2 family glycosyltransferase
VRYFLEQCLISVLKAVENIDAEVFVVDNISTDDSVEMVREKFPEVILIANQENVGFSRANNQAIKISKGEYVLLLNPDTVVEEDAFEKCIEFMDANPKAGGLGVKMIDGNGIFLPESKRGLPTPSVSFYKIFGLSTLFPRSERFAKYHLGYLKENETNEIEVLSGAYMWMRKTVLDQVGYLDEAFFMYGEDIDLSYRITEAGYKNYYFPKTRIIHYKGESTKKGSINYVFVFYNAMIIFSKKHFAKKAKAFSFFINIAIYLRAFLALIFRFISYSKLIINDSLIIAGAIGGLNYLKPHVGFPNQIELGTQFGLLNLLTVILSFVLGIAIFKGYSKSIQMNKTVLGLILSIGILAFFNFLFPKPYSFSNKYIASIAVGSSILIYLSRLILNYFNTVKINKTKKRTIAVLGNESFISKIKNLKNKRPFFAELLKIKTSNKVSSEDYSTFVGKKNQLPDITEIYNVNEVVFSSNDISYKEIIHEMDNTKNDYVDFKISLNDFIIGSKAIEKLT